MKLVVLFMLVTIPICCYANGTSGCGILDNIINGTISSSVSEDEYLEMVKQYILLPSTRSAVKEFKQCFLSQTEDTLSNVGLMMEIIFNSEECQQSS
uniref:Secretoglobin, family 2A, member 2 n=1 Tax=Mus spicilegus TaxID=10103 RepID=A0A8C6I5A2_MUSSI